MWARKRAPNEFIDLLLLINQQPIDYQFNGFSIRRKKPTRDTKIKSMSKVCGDGVVCDFQQ